MVANLPAYRQSRYPNDLPPTLLHPASPKIKPAKPVKEMDTASMASTSTFASTVSLLKSKAKQALPTSYKDHRARKDSQEATALSTVYSDQKKEKSAKKSLPKDSRTRKWLLPDYDARQRTAEASMLVAINK